MPSYPPGTVLHGTCGWTDEGLSRSGFYPPATKGNSAEQLRVYARTLPCVEVDTSTYAIPSPESTRRWADATPPGFLFHVKCFGILAGVGVPLNTLPNAVRRLPCMAEIVTAAPARVVYGDLPSTAADLVWETFHASLRPLESASKLGVVIFQFQSSFGPSAAHRLIVEECRRRLDASMTMAIEFRHRGWFREENSLLESTLKWLRELGIALIAADDLLHEMAQPDRAQTGLPAGSQGPERALIAMHVTNPCCTYVRVHRRHGTHRLLSDDEVREWVTRLRPSTLVDGKGLRGPVHFLWGNSWMDQPIQSARTLAARLSDEAKAEASRGCISA
jgi:uncharacterized protein YecE (DUF72 family)